LGSVPQRSRRASAAFVLSLALVAGALVFGPLAAADPGLESEIEAARSDAEDLEQRIATQSAQVAALEQRAREAGAREMQLQARIEEMAARSRELASRLAAVEAELEAARARLKRAIAVLSERLVEIYKASDPDYVTVILDAEGWDDLATRTEFLDAVKDADERVADRVAALRDEVEARYNEIAALKAQIDEQVRELDAARSEAAASRASTEAAIADLAAARAAQQATLRQVQGEIEGLENQLAEQQAAQAPAFHGGPYSIPTYIVMCESGGNYRALNPSSGAGGAYQILPSTWRAYGGKGLPHQASKAEQDRIAALIWADVGPSAWSCA
jgi:septal ring factor EnvC (AmiA/AmiB activator)